MFLALVLAVAAPVPAPATVNWKHIEAREFKFAGETGADSAVTAAKKAGLAAEFTPGQGVGEFTFQKKDCPKVTFSGHAGTAVVIRGDVLYVADFGASSNGCKVVAYDLTTGKKTWTSPLDGIGLVDHFRYRNSVAMAIEKHPTEDQVALVITGNESFGRYIEVLDLTTGKQLAHKKFAAGK